MKGVLKRSRFIGGAAAVLASVVLSDVSAQSGTRGDDAPRGAEGGGRLVDKEMTTQEKIAWVEEQVAAAQGIYTRVESMLEEAKKEKDSIKISCLQDKLQQLEVNLQGVEERRMLFEDALSRGDEGDANQQFRMLQIYITRVQSLMAEAENCIGEGDVVIGESDTKMTIDDDVTDNDPTEPIDWQVGVDQPVHASGYF
jgi:hypothetical protein